MFLLKHVHVFMTFFLSVQCIR